MNRNNRRDCRNPPLPASYGPRGPNAPPASQSGRWPNTTGPRLRPKVPAPFEDQPTSTPITWNGPYMSKLRALIQSASIMQKQGYTTQLLNERELLLKRRCAGCGKTMFQITKKMSEIIGPKIKLDTNNSTLSASRDLPNPDPAKPPPLHCKFHAGQVVNRIWTCCKQHVSSGVPPCGGAPAHIPQFYHPNELVKLYQYHSTPEPEFPLRLSSKIRSAVALDCEMGTAVSGDCELIRITVIDYFTSEILLNSLVEPDVPMSHLNTQYSGVTWADLRNAKRNGVCLYGTAAARKALWRFVGPQTVVVGHGASSDLRTLRWIHNAVVDSQVVEFARMKNKQEEKEAVKKLEMIERGGDVGKLPEDGNPNVNPVVPGATAVPKQKKPKGTGDLALKTLAKKYLGRDIQMKGKVGHDSLEDAVAARDVVHWQVSNPQWHHGPRERNEL